MKRFIASLLAAIFLCSSAPVQANDKKNSNQEDWEVRSDRGEQWFFHDLPRHIGNDLKYTFWNGWHLVALAGGAVAIAGVHAKDQDIQRAFQPERPFGRIFDDVMKWGGHPAILGGAAAVTFGVSKLVGAEKTALTAGTMVEALTLTEVLTTGLQFATQRRRPDGSNSQSFPSGHTSGAFALAAVIEEFYGPWFGVPSFALASLVGISRIDSNKHVASDVLAGALLGTLMGLGTAKFHKKEFSKFFLIPTAEENSAGLMLVHPF